MKKYIYYFLVVVLAVSCQNSSDLLDLSPSSSSDVTSNRNFKIEVQFLGVV